MENMILTKCQSLISRVLLIEKISSTKLKNLGNKFRSEEKERKDKRIKENRREGRKKRRNERRKEGRRGKKKEGPKVLGLL